ncbi:hypothetical protein [Nocardia sp. NPDC057668]|uniref:hypothetical protein n=1 Tax=Nocardia sp. NPDC057668 TaxID=3346202 RepID=UPI00366F9F0D
MAVLAHGIGGAADLPIPLSYALVGAAWALTFSFAILIFAWKQPRLDPRSPGLLLPAGLRAVIDAPRLRDALAALGVVATVVVTAIALFGSPDPARNPAPGVLYIFLWVGVMAASLLLGPVWKILSPARAIHRLIRRSDTGTGPLAYREGWGHWPAAASLFSFVWLELAYPDPGAVAAVTIWFLGYLATTTLGLFLFGSVWAERADPIEVYSSLLGRLIPLGRRDTGEPVLRSPLANLAGTPARAGSVAVAATLLGSTAFDSFSMFPSWRSLLVKAEEHSQLRATGLATLGLLGFIAVVGGAFWLAARATGGLSPAARAKLPNRLAHSLTPIIAGYLIAHYLTFLVEKGQTTIILFADPFDRGWNLAGLADRDTAYLLSTNPALLGTIKVMAVLTGHILGVTAAHDRCLRLLPPAHRLTGQLALMLTMVGFTFAGLYLLFEA